MDKEECLLRMDNEVFPYRLQPLFYMINDNNKDYIVKNPHIFSVEEVIDHHIS